MAISGDIRQFPGIEFGVTVFVNSSGEVSADPTDTQVFDVSKVIDGSYEDVLQLIGYSRIEIEYLFVHEILRSTDEVKTRLKSLPQRVPNSFLLEDNGRLYGVVIDGSGQTRVVGVVTRVIPGRYLENSFKSVLIDRDDNWMFCSLRDSDIEEKIISGTFFGFISREGFLFLQIKRNPIEELSELVLLLNGGYYLIENARIDWIRPKSKDDNQITRSEIGHKECLITRRGGCVRTDNRFQVYGIENSIVSFEILRERMFGPKNSKPKADSDEDLAQNTDRNEGLLHSSPKHMENHWKKTPEKKTH